MTVVWAKTGACTSSTALVFAKVTGASTRLAYTSDPDFVSPAFTDPVAPDAEGIARFNVTGLSQGTRYYYQIEDDAVLDAAVPGEWVTHGPVGEPVSFGFGMATCAGLGSEFPGEGDVLAADRLSNHPVFDSVRERALEDSHLFFLHGGDRHYYDIGSGVHVPLSDVATYRRADDDVMLQSRQHELYRTVPTYFMWDDHDYGPNNSDKTAPGRANALQVMRERDPLPPLAFTDPENGNAYAFEVGRCLFIVSDCRSQADPNDTEQSPAKTMLGEAQKAWMESVLSTSTAEALFWVNSRQWLHPTVTDTWAGFADERLQLVAMFAAPGGDASKSWLDRMCILSGDAHSIGIANGSANPYGGFPVYQMASLDSTPGGSQSWFDVATLPGRGQYGAFNVNDSGSRITITCTAYADTDALVTHSFHIDTDTDPEPEPEPEAPTDSVATATAVVQWVACDASTGDVLKWLPGLTGDIEKQLSAYSTAGLNLPAPLWGQLSLGADVSVVTRPMRTWLCLIVNDKPAWLGYVVKVQDGVGVDISLSAASIEAMLDNLYVTDQAHTGADESVIVQGLLQPALESGIHMVLDCPPTGTLRGRTYHGTDDATIYKRLQELTDVEGGPEWTIVPEWDIPNRRIVAVFKLRKRIGKTVPSVEFSTTGQTKARWTRTRDFSRGRFATRVMAYSSGEGEDRPQSAVHVATSLESAGWPRVEHRFSPSSSITAIPVLDAHASNTLRQIQHGTTSVEITVRRDAEPGRWAVDWDIGDTVKWDLRGHTEPNGWLGRGRVIGWRMAVASGDITPVIIMED